MKDITRGTLMRFVDRDIVLCCHHQNRVISRIILDDDITLFFISHRLFWLEEAFESRSYARLKVVITSNDAKEKLSIQFWLNFFLVVRHKHFLEGIAVIITARAVREVIVYREGIASLLLEDRSLSWTHDELLQDSNVGGHPNELHNVKMLVEVLPSRLDSIELAISLGAAA